MATRMQQRRGTATQWTTANPVLNAGEIGFESDTNKFKIGDGTNTWSNLDYFIDEDQLDTTLGDYVETSLLGQVNGVATLNSAGKLESSQLPSVDELSQDAINTALVAGTGLDKTYDDNANTITLDIDSTVTTNTGTQTLTNKSINLANNTISGTTAEFNTALSDSNFVTTGDTGSVTSTMILDGTIVNDDINASAAIALSKLATDPLARANHTGTQTASTISDFNEAAQDAVGGILGSGLTYTDASNTITVDSTVVQLRVANVTDTELGYLDGVTSNVQAQLDAKAALSGAAFTGSISTTNNLTVDGNFTVNGSNVLVSATQIQIEDSIIQLAHENPANTVDIGIVAGYNDGSAKHAGFVKDATDGKWKLFDGVTDEPTTTVNFAQATLDDLVVGGLEASSLTVGDVSNTEFGYLANVTSDIQSQIDGKISASSTDTLTSKSINLANNTVTGTLAQFNTALSDADFATLAGTETLSGKTLANATVTGTITANGGVGSAGQYLESTGTGVQWTTVTGYAAPTLGSTSIASGATVTTIAGLTLTAPTLTGTVTASGDINLSAANGPGSLIDELNLLMMGAL